MIHNSQNNKRPKATYSMSSLGIVAAALSVLIVPTSAASAAQKLYNEPVVDIISASTAKPNARVNVKDNARGALRGKSSTTTNLKTATVAINDDSAANHPTADTAKQNANDKLTILEDLEFWDRHLQGSGDPGPGPTPAPAPAPGPGPTPTPTVCNGLTPQQRERQILDEITSSDVSSRQDIADDKSPQGQALDWITNDDEAELCPDSSNLIQRYIMAVFYYSTDGDSWSECSAGSESARVDEDKPEEQEAVIVVEEPVKIEGRTGGGNKNNKDKDRKNKGGQDNCLKYCRDKCCKDNGGDRLCNSKGELECRSDCFVEVSCEWEEAKKELEKERKKRDKRDRDRKDKKDKRKNKKSKKGGRDKSRRLQADLCGGPSSAFPGKSPYLSSSSECDWAGSECAGGDITVVGFEQNNLGGTFPAEILALSKLKNLTLEGGRTSGTIPEEWGSGVWSGESLQVLDLDQNRLSGPLNDNLFNLEALKVLDIDENRLEGTLSPRVGKLVNLVFVEFEENKFEGEIPDDFSNLKKLRTATFRGNDFKGEMPESVCENRVPNGLLNILTADCAGDDPKVECSCCSSCF